MHDVRSEGPLPLSPVHAISPQLQVALYVQCIPTNMETGKPICEHYARDGYEATNAIGSYSTQVIEFCK